VAWNTPSSAYPRAPLKLVRVRHHPNACDDRVSAQTLIFFSFFFLGFTLDLFLQLGVLVVICQTSAQITTKYIFTREIASTLMLGEGKL
jgi:hypothetical protein